MQHYYTKEKEILEQLSIVPFFAGIQKSLPFRQRKKVRDLRTPAKLLSYSNIYVVPSGWIINQKKQDQMNLDL